MTTSELAELLAGAGTFLIGLAAVITATKKKPSEPQPKPKARKYR